MNIDVMRATQIMMCLMLSFALQTGCKRPSSITLSEIGHGLRHEKLIDQDGARVISLESAMNDGGRDIVVPGDVVWFRTQSGKIWGMKDAFLKPAPWMDAAWDKSGFFLIEPLLINRQAASDEERFGRAIKWFDSEEELKRSL